MKIIGDLEIPIAEELQETANGTMTRNLKCKKRRIEGATLCAKKEILITRDFICRVRVRLPIWKSLMIQGLITGLLGDPKLDIRQESVAIDLIQ